MRENKVIAFMGSLVRKLEPEFTLRLVDVIYSKAHGHELCVMQVVGKNAFPTCTAEELLADPKAMLGLSPQDAVTITRLDCAIKERKNRLRVLDVDRNGTILLRDESGNECRYSEKLLSSERELLKSLDGEDAHDLGYRVGFREGFQINRHKMKASDALKSGITE
ncbi:hypothetical protein [Legionella sp. CNM-4043-24]|uniref:hypothetical protein n=1 Tax=Legionella sp. CNM-4043-24 TaxID=3421646 RepID=UPI00403A93E0